MINFSSWLLKLIVLIEVWWSLIWLSGGLFGRCWWLPCGCLQPSSCKCGEYQDFNNRSYQPLISDQQCKITFYLGFCMEQGHSIGYHVVLLSHSTQRIPDVKALYAGHTGCGSSESSTLGIVRTNRSLPCSGFQPCIEKGAAQHD